tara:strand:- start:41 stop:247 length:207 start_codon:yes stop_codon:yes gene_type:complete
LTHDGPLTGADAAGAIDCGRLRSRRREDNGANRIEKDRPPALDGGNFLTVFEVPKKAATCTWVASVLE